MPGEEIKNPNQGDSQAIYALLRQGRIFTMEDDLRRLKGEVVPKKALPGRAEERVEISKAEEAQRARVAKEALTKELKQREETEIKEKKAADERRRVEQEKEKDLAQKRKKQRAQEEQREVEEALKRSVMERKTAERQRSEQQQAEQERQRAEQAKEQEAEKEKETAEVREIRQQAQEEEKEISAEKEAKIKEKTAIRDEKEEKEEKKKELLTEKRQIERSLTGFSAKIRPLESKKKRLLERKAELEKVLTVVSQQESEIQKEENAIEEQERRTTAPEERHQFERKRWALEKKRRVQEQEKWKQQQLVNEFSESLKKTESSLGAILEEEAVLEKRKQSISRELQAIKLIDDKKTLESQLNKLEQKRVELEEQKDKARQKEDEVEVRLRKAQEEESEVEKEVAEIESREARATALEQKELGEKRWQAEDKRKDIEKARWDLEGELKEISRTRKEFDGQLEQLIRQQSQAQEKVSEIETFIEFGIEEGEKIIARKKEQQEPAKKVYREEAPALPAQPPTGQPAAEKPAVREAVKTEDDRRKEIAQLQEEKIITEIQRRAGQEAQKELGLEKPLPKDKILKKLSQLSQEEQAERERFLARVSGRDGRAGAKRADERKEAFDAKLRGGRNEIVFRPIVQGPSGLEKVLIRVLVLFLIVGLGVIIYLAVHSYLDSRNDQPENGGGQPYENGEPPIIPNGGDEEEVVFEQPLAPIIAVATTTVYQYSTSSEIASLLNSSLDEELTTGNFYQIAFQDSQTGRILRLRGLFDIVGATSTEEFWQQLGEPASSTEFIYASADGNFFGFIAQVEDMEIMQYLLNNWESAMPDDLSPLTSVLAGKPLTFANSFKTAGESSGVAFKYLDSTNQGGFGLCYAVAGGHFLFATNGATMLKLIDNFITF